MSTWYNQSAPDRSWHTLLNAEHINAVLLHAKVNPHLWGRMKYGTARAIARNEATKRTHLTDRIAAQVEASKLYSPDLPQFEASAMMHAAEDAFLALAAWHDCAYMLDLHPDVVRTLAGSGNHAAVLLLPAIIAMRGDDDGSDGTSAEGVRPEAV